MNVHIEKFRGAAAEWDGFVRAQPGWTHFHLAGWRDVIADVHGHQAPFLCARDDDGKLAGVLPLVRVASPVFGRYLVSMPYVNYGGPLGTSGAVQALVRAASTMASAENGTLLELRSRYELPVTLRVSHRKITCVLDLPNSDSGAVWRTFDTNVKRRVRRAQKAGITLAFGPDQLGPFFTVFSRHMRDLGTPAQPRLLFEKIVEAFPGCHLRLRLSRNATYRHDRRFSVGRRVRSDLGFRAQGAQGTGGEHAHLLGVHGARGGRGRAQLQLRPVLPRKRNAPVQAAVGSAR